MEIPTPPRRLDLPRWLVQRGVVGVLAPLAGIWLYNLALERLIFYTYALSEGVKILLGKE